ncbi:hypothetical protein CC77DRAFT_1024508 [Alternaria alternata]|uniref:Uncharacterized protein n=1 Tax=Alternaria alternata TaxID=5599 RepID=A0A177DAE8_ALTAL|nr:hypothetical protein CC77DRAFT_1024508 [Alternaria alternata]OAG16082.1 hypothetical protein CC77DRAFT_1024508 [Alternaria alternata]
MLIVAGVSLSAPPLVTFSASIRLCQNYSLGVSGRLIESTGFMIHMYMSSQPTAYLTALPRQVLTKVDCCSVTFA